jgi:hypothetical protein
VHEQLTKSPNQHYKQRQNRDYGIFIPNGNQHSPGIILKKTKNYYANLCMVELIKIKVDYLKHHHQNHKCSRVIPEKLCKVPHPIAKNQSNKSQ